MQLLELVPRTWDQLLNEAEISLEKYDYISGFNIPDVRRLSIRSLEVVSKFLERGWHIVPHIRSRDYSLDKHLELLEPLVESGLKDVLVVRGDAIKDDAKSFGCSSIELILKLKQKFPSLIIYGALDPYRWDWDREKAYIDEKLEAGVSGFFTQPLFDLSLVDTILSELKSTCVFVGVAPVTSQSSREYWESVNKVSFPKSFEFTLEGSGLVAKQIVQHVESYSQHIYHMPIVVNPISYLSAIDSL